MDRKRILRRPRLGQCGSFIIEMAVTMVVGVTFSTFLLYTTIATFSNTTFAAYCCVAQNFIANELSCVKASSIASDGSLTLPSLSQMRSSDWNGATTVQDIAIFGTDSSYRAEVTSKRDAVEEVVDASTGSVRKTFNYTITVQFRVPSAGGPPKYFESTGVVTLVSSS